MAKRKRRKSSKKSASYSIELKGILFLLIAIVGCCPFGIAADIIKGFAAFLAGGWYIVPLLGLGAAGLYMIVKREDPDYLTSHLIGLYCLMLGILVLSHTEYINSFIGKGVEAGKIFNETINNIMGFVKHTGEIEGGGIIGAIFSVIGYKLLTLEGTKVVCAFLIVCGLIMKDGKCLIAKRKKDDHVKGKWEFPGGRRQGLEDEKKSLERAFNELYKINTNINDYLTHTICEYPGHIVDLKLYECEYVSGDFELSTHSEYKWVNIEDLLDYDLAEADVILTKFLLKREIEKSRNKEN